MICFVLKTACKRKSKDGLCPSEEQETVLITILISLLSVLAFVGGTIEMSKECRAPGVMDSGDGYFASVLRHVFVANAASFLQSRIVDVDVHFCVSFPRLLFVLILNHCGDIQQDGSLKSPNVILFFFSFFCESAEGCWIILGFIF